MLATGRCAPGLKNFLSPAGDTHPISVKETRKAFMQVWQIEDAILIREKLL